MKIAIVTGIFPPQIGGPAQYAKNLAQSLKQKGITVIVLTYGMERKLPTGLRHLLFFMRCLFRFAFVDAVIALDQFSVGLPAVAAARLWRRPTVIRTGGDFLWEQYVERTADLVLLKDFYNTIQDNQHSLGEHASIQNQASEKLNLKERLIFRLSGWTLRNANTVIFSTSWQRDIFIPAYNLNVACTAIIENYFGPKEQYQKHNVVDAQTKNKKKIFLGSTRPINGKPLKWKNTLRLKAAVELARQKNPDIELDLENASYDQFMEKIKQCYAVVLVSLGDISPNLILDALRLNKPCIMTRECGFYEQLKDVVLIVDPENIRDIAEKIEALCQSDVYSAQLAKVQAFKKVHTWQEISEEFLKIICK